MNYTAIRLPVTEHKADNGEQYLFCETEGIDLSGSGWSPAKARADLKEKVLSALRTHCAREKHRRRRVLGTYAGEVLIVEYQHGSYGYSIWGPARKSHTGCFCGGTFEEALDRARKHAEQSYAGVAWEL